MWLNPKEDGSIHYLPFKSDHLEKASIVYTECFNGPPWHDGWTHDTAKERLGMLLDYPNSIGLVAIRNEEVVGLVIGNCESWTDGISYYLNELCVSSNEQRSGIGQSLLEILTNVLRKREVESVYLLTEHSSPAESFFLKQGFEIDSTVVKLWKSVRLTKAT
jgi:ribosomal protein S18 acetylase RimI-like enzyme